VAASVRRPHLRSRLEESAIDLLTHFSTENFEAGLKSINLLKAILNLSASVYEVEVINKQILLEELNSLAGKIKELFKSEFSGNITDLFKKKEKVLEPIGNAANQLPIDLPDELPIQTKVADSIADDENIQENAMVSIATAIRQSAILEKIRSMSVRDGKGQLIGCKMKDLLATFPDVSERTIRNDLQRLLNRGSVERIGTGGATSAYVIK
jgi:hypothetical protein